MSGRHRSYGHIGRGRLRVPVALAVFSALVVITAVAVRIVAANASGCTGGIALRVVATPEIASVLADIGAEWMATEPEVGDQCVDLTVGSAASPTVASGLTVRAGRGIDVAAAPQPTPSPDALPMVWVPDSSAWLLRVQTIDRAAFEPNALSIASSPVVIAMPEATARALGGPARQMRVETVPPLLAQGSLRLGIAEPRRETASMAMTMMLGAALAATEEELPALVSMFRGVVTTSSTGELLHTFGVRVNAGPASEQAVLAFNATGPGQPLTAVRLDPAAPRLDYPYAIRAGLPRPTVQAAEAFRRAVLASRGAAALAAKAFRGPDGTVGAAFPSASTVPNAPSVGDAITDSGLVQRTLALWSAANSPSRTLALLDVTSSVGEVMRTAGGATRADVMVAAATGGLDLFTADSRVGMWTFAATHAEEVPIDDLTPEHRLELAQRMSDARPSTGNRSELYAAVLAAYRTMRDGYDVTRPNIIVVLTDGGDSDTSARRRGQFNLALQQLADPTKPIGVVLIGVGVGPADSTRLDTIAQTVGGEHVALTSPEQIQTIFLDALLRVGAR